MRQICVRFASENVQRALHFSDFRDLGKIVIAIPVNCITKKRECISRYSLTKGSIIIGNLCNIDMDNSVSHVSYFSELFIREFWTKCNKITRILYIFERPELSEETTQKTGEKEGGQISGQIISDREKEILSLIRENPRISREELSEKIKINPSAIQKHISKLKKKGVLRRTGPDKGGYWEIIRKDNLKKEDNGSG